LIIEKQVRHLEVGDLTFDLLADGKPAFVEVIISHPRGDFTIWYRQAFRGPRCEQHPDGLRHKSDLSWPLFDVPQDRAVKVGGWDDIPPCK
jgi:hypothetical protein